MSAPRYRIHPKVIALLHERGETVASLATQAGTGRAHASQVLANKPGRGGHTRHKIACLLRSAELDLLRWDGCGRLLEPKPQTEGVPPGTFQFLQTKNKN